jgi:hypothetical protein
MADDRTTSRRWGTAPTPWMGRNARNANARTVPSNYGLIFGTVSFWSFDPTLSKRP